MDIYDALPTLKDAHVRLLRVQLKSDVTETISCRLDVVRLTNTKDKPAFVAASYTWGSPWTDADSTNGMKKETEAEKRTGTSEDTELKGTAHSVMSTTDRRNCRILCNGKDLMVTKNLRDFLHRYSHSQKPQSQGYIWTDAICINQDDYSERSQQVNLMAEIYQAATGVIIWLGEEDESTSPAFALLEALAALSQQKRRDLHPRNVFAKSPNILEDLEHWTALARLFRRTWFQRAWIIQEVIFAKEASLLCGSHSLPWDSMTTVSDFLATSSWGNYLSSPEVSGVVGRGVSSWHSIPARLAAMKRAWASPLNDGLLYALIRSRSSQCQDPRDKVYSQLQLGNASIFPRYNSSIAEVYITATRYILDHTDNLLLLTCVEGEDFQEIPGLPSWVPDWSVTKSLGLGVTGYSHFSAAGDRPRKFAVYGEADHLILLIEAAELDKITEICETKEEIRQCARPLKLYQVLSTLDPVYFTEQSREEVLWRTLITNRSGAQPVQRIQYPAFASLERAFHDWVLWRYTVAFQEMSRSQQTAFLASDPVSGLSTPNGILPSIADIRNCIEKSSRDADFFDILKHSASSYDLHYSHTRFLRPFRTRQGFFGLGTQSLRAGDSVWVVPGSRVPLVLRRQSHDSQRYRLVGGAYVHGFMIGQALGRSDLRFGMVKVE